MTTGVNLRNIMSGAVLALAMAIAVSALPVHAQAKSSETSGDAQVCNTASHNGTGGGLVAFTDNGEDPQSPVHNSTDLAAKGNSNVNAAMHSRALSLCGTRPTGDSDWGGSPT